MRFKVVIPARLASTRLPRKVLLPIEGQPLIRYVWQAARRSGADEVVIATDSAEVRRACRDFGAEAVMTSRAHQSGTDRVNEVARKKRWAGGAVVVNLQGDEPLMPPRLIRQAAQLLAQDRTADIATLGHPLYTAAEWLNPNFVKVVLDVRGHALYFSRGPIPWNRDGSIPGSPALPAGLAYRHIGLYAYRVAALKRFSAMPPARLEQSEALEQLRAIANGLSIRVGITRLPPPRGVDTPEDLDAVRAVLKKKPAAA